MYTSQIMESLKNSTDDQLLKEILNYITIYDKNEYNANKEGYIKEQIVRHKKHKEYVNRNLRRSYGILNEKINEDENLFEILDEMGGLELKLRLKKAHIQAAIPSLLKKTSYKKDIEDDIKDYNNLISLFGLLKEISIEGAQFFKECDNHLISKDAKNSATECIKICKDLSFLYGRLEQTTKKIMESDKKIFQIFYPNL